MRKFIVFAISLAVLFALGLTLWNNPLGQSVEVVSAQEGVVPEDIPFLDEWSGSGHADEEAEAFRHWDEDDPAEVPARCAKCHSTPGHLDFLGADGSEAGTVDAAAPLDSTVECVACHNEVTINKTSVVMPSGVEITDLGDEARCMECHQGRQSMVSVNAALEEAGATEEDAVNADLGFLNIHYYAAAATKYGTVAKGGYEYEGRTYDANFAHVDGFNTCIECHDSHTLELRVEECSECHEDVATVEDVRNIRMQGSLVDYDGDGDVEEGIYAEIEGLQGTLIEVIQTYAANVSGQPIGYSEHHPYFFIDADGDGTISEEEATDEGAYDSWTPRLLKAAYNYQTSIKDPGAYAHGGKYIIQLLSDSIENLNEGLSEPVEVADIHRIDDGHFAGSEEAFRHWDEEGEVPGTCSKCHTAEGLPLFLKDGATISQEPSNGFQCTTCHNVGDDAIDMEAEEGELATEVEEGEESEFPIYEVAEVTFPSGETVSSEDLRTNLCMNCHQGRTSTVTVNNAITEELEDDVVSEELGFINIHYFAAGATRYGTEAKGAYEYADKEYVGFYRHRTDYRECVECHSAHGLNVEPTECAECHEGVETEEDLVNIRETIETDYDGDGDSEEGVAQEIETMHEALYTAIQDYANETVGTAIIYDSHRYPYFFADTNGNGEVDEDDGRYSTWTPRLLRAAYNYQYVAKDPGAFTHNPEYIMQALYDSLEDMGADVSGMTRP